MDAAIVGDVPIGSGLSSSAALEVASAVALCGIAGVSVDAVELAKICQRAESEFVGMQCGIMDQFIALFGQPGHALLIDCRSLERELVPLPNGTSIVVCDTMKRRGLVESEYNVRRQQCEAGVGILSEHLQKVEALRDVTAQELKAHADSLPGMVLRRCRHVVSENQRVLKAVGALRDRDVATFGRLMDLSHESLREDYEVSCRELDEMVRLARVAPGCLGARMTGAGFGGCTVNLVSQDQAEAFAAAMHEGYSQAVGLEPEVYVCQASAGAGEVVAH
jgi:galactokinase